MQMTAEKDISAPEHCAAAEDMEQDAFSKAMAEFSEGEDESDAGGTVVPSGKKVFTFVRPTFFYGNLMKQVGTGARTTAGFLVQNTASPNAAIAAAELGIQQVAIYCPRPPQHQLWHGKDVLRDHFLRVARKGLGLHSRKRSLPTLMSDLQWLHAKAEQASQKVVEVWDIMLTEHEAISGIDLIYIQQAMTDAYFGQELDAYDLIVRDD